ncbi:hypothetical protein lerEdw1_013442 [Lerista edwardsae]|nr:hypothetical protein lerEdw1_013444 [Lerista edwardsae]KAJ6650281.1 hypothetical protein lerEdw1_013442 [Lerista edwardsae]
MSLLASFTIRLIGYLLVGPFTGVQASDCKYPDWLNFRGSCYGFFSEELTWHRADHSCETQGGHLATIENDQEYEAVGSFLNKMGAYEDSSKSDFIAASPLEVSPMDYREKERPGESSPSPGSTPWVESEGPTAQKDNLCGALDQGAGFKHGKYMSCKETLPFLCEMDLH